MVFIGKASQNDYQKIKINTTFEVLSFYLCFFCKKNAILLTVHPHLKNEGTVLLLLALCVTRPHMNLFFTCEDNYTNLVGLSLKIKENLCAVSGTQLPKGAVFC